MSIESLNRTSNVNETPSKNAEDEIKVNVDVLKQRMLENQKKRQN